MNLVGLCLWSGFIFFLISQSLFQLCLCKEQFKEEAALKNEALKQKAFIQQLLYSKSQVSD